MNLIFFILIELTSSIVLIWKTAVIMIEQEKIIKFLPFFAAGIIMGFDAAFVMHQIYLNIAWLWIEISYILAISFILINLIIDKTK